MSAVDEDVSFAAEETTAAGAELPPLGRRQLSALLLAAGSHAGALAQSLENIAGDDPAARPLIDQARRVDRTAKDERFLELLRQSHGEKMLVFATFRRTLEHLQQLLTERRRPVRHLLRGRIGEREGCRRGRFPRPAAGDALLGVGRRGPQPPVRQHAGQLRPARGTPCGSSSA